MKRIGLRFPLQAIQAMSMAVSLLVFGACANLPQLPDLPLPNNSSAVVPSRPEQQSTTALMTRGPKKRIAVMQFEVKTKATSGQQVNLMATEMLTTALVQTGEFIVVDRASLDKVLKEQGLGLSGFIDSSTAAEVGKVLGVQALVTGAVTNMGTGQQTMGVMQGVSNRATVTNVDLDVRLIDTTTAAILLAETGKGSNSASRVQVQGIGTSQQTTQHNEALGKAVRDAVDSITRKIVAQMQKVEWTGLIANITGRDVYINAGEDLGLKTGHTLTVFRPGMVVKDPATGQILGQEEKEIGQVLVKQVRDRFAIAEIQSGSGFARNDMVRLAKQ